VGSGLVKVLIAEEIGGFDEGSLDIEGLVLERCWVHAYYCNKYILAK